MKPISPPRHPFWCKTFGADDDALIKSNESVVATSMILWGFCWKKKKSQRVFLDWRGVTIEWQVMDVFFCKEGRWHEGSFSGGVLIDVDVQLLCVCWRPVFDKFSYYNIFFFSVIAGEEELAAAAAAREAAVAAGLLDPSHLGKWRWQAALSLLFRQLAIYTKIHDFFLLNIVDDFGADPDHSQDDSGSTSSSQAHE